MKTIFLPVDPVYYEPIEQAISSEETAVAHYFGEGNTLKNAKGNLKKITTSPDGEEFILFDNGQKVRIDRIIVFNGRPGPAFDEYDSYALACLDCTGGMD